MKIEKIYFQEPPGKKFPSQLLIDIEENTAVLGINASRPISPERRGKTTYNPRMLSSIKSPFSEETITDLREQLLQKYKSSRDQNI